MTDEPSLPATMLAALLTGNGGPELLEVSHDVPVPTPADDEVLVEVAACGMNNTDINTRVGWYSRSVAEGTSSERLTDARTDDSTWGGGGLTFPRIQGADVVGRVVAVGSDAPASLAGARVLVDPWIRDPDRPADRSLAGYLGSERDGGFAEYCAVPARNAHPITTDLTDVELASFPCSWSTAEHMLQRIGLAAGQSIAITGASGGVGSALVQLAKLRRARVVAIAGPSKLEAVRALGADELVARDVDDVPAAVVDANGGPLSAVADVVGGSDFPRWLEALARGGRYVTSGAIAGPIVELDLRTLYLNDLELYGATVFEPQLFADLVGHIESGAVRPVVGGTYPLAEIHAAQEAFSRKDHVGALVLTLAR